MDNLDYLKKKIETILSASTIPEDLLHSTNTLRWLLKFAPHSDDALQIAALGHDIERALEDRKVKREDFSDFNDFKAAHARNSAGILKEMMDECGIEKDFADDVFHLVCHHESGGDPRSDLLKEADGLSFFDVNLPLYFKREGWKETKRRGQWGYQRLSIRAKNIVDRLSYKNQELNNLLKSIIEGT